MVHWIQVLRASRSRSRPRRLRQEEFPGFGGAFLTAVLICMSLVAAKAATLPNDLVVTDPDTENGFGAGISRLGDVNGDGLADFAVCVPRMQLPEGGEGEVRIYFGSRTGVLGVPSQTLRPPNVEAGFGSWVAAGDLNRDGISDAVVQGQSSEGTNGVVLSLWVFLGSTRGLVTPEGPAFSTITQGGRGGFTCLGDVNGDRFSDFALGLPANGNGTGEVFILHGNRACRWEKPDTKLVGSHPGEYFGTFGQAPGDLNGDGFADLLAGSTHFRQWDICNGRAQLFLGSPTGIGSNAVWSATYPLKARPGMDENHDQYFGSDVAGVGDVNRDGHPDIIVTAPFAEQTDRNEGLAFGYYGTTNGPSSDFDWSIQANRPHAVLGMLAAGAGDLNGDGYADVLVGAPDFENGQLREGLVTIFFGSSKGLRKEPDWTMDSNITHARLGMFGAGVGDLNGDGFDDLVLSQARDGNGDINRGVLRVIYGSPVGPRRSAEIRLAKPFPQWLEDEWRRLPIFAKAALGTLGLGLAYFGFLMGRNIWRKRTIILVERHERASRVEERERLARDLHDELGSRISRINLIAEMVREDPDFPGAIRTFTDTLSQEAKDMRTAIEKLASSLEPCADTTDGLVRALSQHANSFFSGTSIRCLQELPVELPSVQLTEGVRAELFPCVREALANVLSHSKASEVWFKVRSENSLLKISIEDNGVGLPTTMTRTGNGLRNLRTRMASVGGKFSVRSTPGFGTGISFEVPTKSKSQG